jgi:hypothetical protein
VLRTRKAKKPPRGLRFELVPGQPPRLILEPGRLSSSATAPVLRIARAWSGPSAASASSLLRASSRTSAASRSSSAARVCPSSGSSTSAAPRSRRPSPAGPRAAGRAPPRSTPSCPTP